MIDITLAACDRLKADLADRFALIGNVADFEAVAGLPRVLPAAYVLPLSESAELSQTVGESCQVHDCTFGVTLIVRHARDAAGARATDALGPLREAVQACLVGWIPDGCMSMVAFGQGSLLDFADGATVWRDDFSVRRQVRRTAPVN